jgi:hypothetical protein
VPVPAKASFSQPENFESLLLNHSQIDASQANIGVRDIASPFDRGGS